MLYINVATTLSYDRKELLEIRTAIPHLELDKEFLFNKLDERDLLHTTEQALIPSFAGERDGKGIAEGANVLLQQLLANVQSQDNKLDKLKACIFYQQDI